MQKTHICWSCKGVVSGKSPFCDTCGAVQPLAQINAFELFSLPVSFDLDEQVLEQRYLALQQMLHPDNFAHKTQAEQMHALTWGSFLNDAYNKLKCHIQLSCEVLDINGICNVLNRKPSMILMTEQFELREALEDTNNLENLKQEVEEKDKICYNAIASAFKENDYETAADKTVELQFLRKFMKDVKRKIRKEKRA